MQPSSPGLDSGAESAFTSSTPMKGGSATASVADYFSAVDDDMGEVDEDTELDTKKTLGGFEREREREG